MISPSQTAFGQSEWCRYVPRTFEDLFQKYRDQLQPVGVLLSHEQYPSVVEVTYTGRFRKIPPEKERVIQDYFEGVVRAPALSGMYEDELLVRLNERELWLPIQNPLAKEIVRDLSREETFYVYAIWAGARVGQQEVDWVLLVNAFETPRSRPFWDVIRSECGKEVEP